MKIEDFMPQTLEGFLACVIVLEIMILYLRLQ